MGGGSTRTNVWSRETRLVGSVDVHGKVWDRETRLVGSVGPGPGVYRRGAALLLLL
jgi:hypothetical protein